MSFSSTTKEWCCLLGAEFAVVPFGSEAKYKLPIEGGGGGGGYACCSTCMLCFSFLPFIVAAKEARVSKKSKNTRLERPI